MSWKWMSTPGASLGKMPSNSYRTSLSIDTTWLESMNRMSPALSERNKSKGASCTLAGISCVRPGRPCLR